MGNKPTSEFLENLLRTMCSKGIIELRFENNPYLKISYKGSSELFNNKWNIKIYNSGSVVCTDIEHLRQYARGILGPPDKSLKLIKIDDSGWGFPLCGILIGIEIDGNIHTGEIGVEFFREGLFEKKGYLREYSKVGRMIINQKIRANPKTHRIEICNGYVNSILRDDLRKFGYDVRNVEITGKLQDSLEKEYKEYIFKKTGVDLAYDPKEITEEQIVFQYDKALEWGKRNAPYLLKSGWKKIP